MEAPIRQKDKSPVLFLEDARILRQYLKGAGWGRDDRLSMLVRRMGGGAWQDQTGWAEVTAGVWYQCCANGWGQGGHEDRTVVGQGRGRQGR